MSSQFRDLSTAERVQRPRIDDGTVVVSAHPRGAGFRVLSRMARHRNVDDGFSPRHRLDVEPDCVQSA
jgi:hypothetical protein